MKEIAEPFRGFITAVGSEVGEKIIWDLSVELYGSQPDALIALKKTRIVISQEERETAVDRALLRLRAYTLAYGAKVIDVTIRFGPNVHRMVISLED